MFFIFFILKKDKLLHKIQYSKTIKADPSGALLGLIVGLFCGYLTLASIGASSIDLTELTCILYYAFIFFLIIKIYTNFFYNNFNFKLLLIFKFIKLPVIKCYN